MALGRLYDPIYIKSLRDDSVGVAPMKDKAQLHSDPTTKASLLNTQFQSIVVKDYNKGTSQIPTGSSLFLSSII